jgi:hypothetical protein
MDGIDERILPHAGIKDGFGILSTELVRLQRELLEESERCAQRLADRRRAPVTFHRLPDLLAERIRRDRAV